MAPNWIRRSLIAATLLVASTSGAGCANFGQNYNADGVRLYQTGQYPSAMQRFHQSIDTNPRDPDGYYNLASTMHRLGVQNNDKNQLQQAETLYNQCLELNENQPDCQRGLAVLLCDTNRADAAFRLLNNWTAHNPGSAEARVELARLYEETGNTENATAQLQQAVKLDPKNPRAWVALGQLREKSGDPAQAVANYQQSLYLNANQPAVAERVAKLTGRPGGVPAPVFPSPGATRTVLQPTGQPRY